MSIKIFGYNKNIRGLTLDFQVYDLYQSSSFSWCLEPELSKGPLLFSSRQRVRILQAPDGIFRNLQTSSGLSPPVARAISGSSSRPEGW